MYTPYNPQVTSTCSLVNKKLGAVLAMMGLNGLLLLYHMQVPDFFSLIAYQVGIQHKQVTATVELINEGCTTPFIARYRKEVTGALDEVQIEQVRINYIKYTDLAKRKQFILETKPE